MKNFLFDENFIFLKPQFLKTVVTGAEYKNLQLKITDKDKVEYFIHLNSIDEYFYKNKTMLIFSAKVSDETDMLNSFINVYIKNNSEYLISLKNVDMFNFKFLEEFKVKKETFNFVFSEKDNEFTIKFFLLLD